jgi:hypothetical protein
MHRHSGPPQKNMKYATVEDIIDSFPHPILPTVHAEPDYQTIHAIWRLLQAKARAIDNHLGGILGTPGYHCLECCLHHGHPSDRSGAYTLGKSNSPGRAPENVDEGTVAQLSTARYIWEEPMSLDILNDDMVGFANISAREMLDELFMTYGNITAVDLEHNLDHMRRAWEPQKPVDSLFKKIQDCADFSEAGGFIIGHPQQINVGYAKIFSTGHFMSACYRANEKRTIEKT